MCHALLAASLPNWKDLILSKPSGNSSSAAKQAGHGSPPVLILCSGARRCVLLIKALAAFRCQCCKLFAKHLKVSEQVKMLKRFFPIAVG